jgi:hypothetical protein
MPDLNLEKRLAGLSPEARLRVENALKEALEKEGALAAKFDRSGFDRGPYDRESKVEQLEEIEDKFAGKKDVGKG